MKVAQRFHSVLEAATRAAQPFALSMRPRSRRPAHGGIEGRRGGSSQEFLEHREYRPGDDLRHIDWNALARSDKLIVRRFQDEVRPHLDVLLDCSSSMGLEDGGKGLAGLGLGAALITVARQSGWSYRLWLAGAELQPYPLADQPCSAWTLPAFDSSLNPLTGRASWMSRLATGSVRVLVSDFLWPNSPRDVASGMLHESGRSFALQVLGSQDTSPPERGAFHLVDSETGELREVSLDARVRAQYLAGLERHQQRLIQHCRGANVQFARFQADALLQQWDLTPLLSLGLLKPGRVSSGSRR